MMKKVSIGNTDLQVAPINLGGNVFGWTLDEKQSFAILDRFIASGFDFIDTAEMYSFWVDGQGGGQSETILGNWMKSRSNREQIVLATKGSGATGLHPTDSSRNHILKSIDGSLQRLKTDYIDLYYTHYDDEKTPVEETLAAYDEAMKAGKIRHIAVSNISPERLTSSMEASEKLGLPSYQAIQPLYNLVERQGFESVYAPLAEKYGMSVFPYSALASGFLSGKYRSEADFGKSVRGAGAGKYLNERGLSVLTALDKIAAKHGATQTTIALAWLLAQKNVTAPIVSATSLAQLEEITAATRQELDGEDLSLLDEATK